MKNTIKLMACIVFMLLPITAGGQEESVVYMDCFTVNSVPEGKTLPFGYEISTFGDWLDVYMDLKGMDKEDAGEIGEVEQYLEKYSDITKDEQGNLGQKVIIIVGEEGFTFDTDSLAEETRDTVLHLTVKVKKPRVDREDGRRFVMQAKSKSLRGITALMFRTDRRPGVSTQNIKEIRFSLVSEDSTQAVDLFAH